MQYLDYKIDNSWQAIQITQFALLLSACLLIWFLPATHDMCVWFDTQTFKVLNRTLAHYPAWGLLCGYLHHPMESWLNVFVMAWINIIGIFSLPAFQRPKAIANIIYCWLFFQFIIVITHGIFTRFLDIKRASPSIVIIPNILLSESLQIFNLKDTSISSFPAGHALVAVYWAKFSLLFAKAWLRKIIIATAVLLILPRLFSGAHWLSDVVFTICYGLLCYTVAVGTPLYQSTITRLSTAIKSLRPRQEATL